MEDRQGDMCRVCRCEGTHDKPLFYPCLCTGSIKYIHQDCLVQWLKYSKKEYCELCKHKFVFTPIYAPDMPKRLPIRDIASGLLRSVSRAVRCWLHYTLVTIAWLGVVPIAAGRIYRCLFSGSLLTLSVDIFSSDNLLTDSLLGCLVMACTLCTFVGLVWLREQILHGNGGAEWLDNVFGVDNNNQPGVGNENNAVAQQPQQQQLVAIEANENVEAAAADDQDQNNQGAEDNNWNPMEWDRGPEELTWERLLGLDGSLLFLEHVFWVISLNTLFILIFAFCPYHIGSSIFISLNVRDTIAATKFEGLFSALLGYLVAATLLFVVYVAVSLLRLPKAAKLFGLCYTCIKVSLLVIMEIGIFPLVCGWWLDICSLSMFDSSVKDRIAGFKANPATSMFSHWLVGMVYIFYFASFILLLREVLRPGVLWFLRNLNDPDFNPIEEMIHLPVYRHLRRFLTSLVVFGTMVLIMLRMPALFIHGFLPNFLPFHVTLSSPDLPISELSLELLLLQVILPAVLEQGNMRQWVKSLILWWCLAVSHILGIRSYLLGDVPVEVEASSATAEMVAEDLRSEEVQAEQESTVSRTEEQLVNPVDETVTFPPSVENVSMNFNVVDEVSLSQLLIENKILNGEANLGEASTQVSPQQNNENSVQSGQTESSVEGFLISGSSHDSNEQNVTESVEHSRNVADSGSETENAVEGDNENPQPDGTEAQPPDVGNAQPNLANAHQIFENGVGSLGHQPYNQPNYFVIRLLLLVVFMCFTLFLTSLLFIIIPVSIGRCLLGFLTGRSKVHELYTAASGLYVCWLCLRLVIVLSTWLPKGSKVIRDKCKEYFLLLSKMCVAASLIVGLIPLLLGLLFELFVVVPVRVPLNQTPIFSLGQDWALGVLHAKIITACTLIGPQWRLRRVIEQVYNQGLRNMDLKIILTELCLPVIVTLGLILSVPYVVSKSIVPAVGISFEVQHLIERQIYPFILGIFLFVSFCIFQARQFKRLYEHIKNDKYLVGQRLVNYEKRMG